MNMLPSSFLPLSYHIVKCNKERFCILMLVDNHFSWQTHGQTDKKEMRYESRKNLVWKAILK